MTDFGLAALRSDRPSKHQLRGGTAAYLAPEQLIDSAIENTIDIYGLGGSLYAMLTGQPPRVGTPAEVLSQLETGTAVRRPSAVCPEQNISADLDDLVLRCLSPCPDDRFLDVSAFLNAVDDIVQRLSLKE